MLFFLSFFLCTSFRVFMLREFLCLLIYGSNIPTKLRLITSPVCRFLATVVGCPKMMLLSALFSNSALPNPFATRHMWRMTVLMWRMTLFLNTSKTVCFCTKLGLFKSIHTFLSKTTEMGGEMAQDISFL